MKGGGMPSRKLFCYIDLLETASRVEKLQQPDKINSQTPRLTRTPITNSTTTSFLKTKLTTTTATFVKMKSLKIEETHTQRQKEQNVKNNKGP